MNEIGSMTKAIEGDKEDRSTTVKKKVRLIIEGECEFDRANYAYIYDENGNNVNLDEEQRAALTAEEMLEYDWRLFDKGELSWEDVADTLEGSKITFEVVEDA